MAADMSGQRFGKLTVIRRDGNCANGLALWLVACDCGEQRSVIGANLRKGVTRSCGCNTHCAHGHPFSGTNTGTRSADGSRFCRACRKVAWQRYKAKKDGAA